MALISTDRRCDIVKLHQGCTSLYLSLSANWGGGGAEATELSAFTTFPNHRHNVIRDEEQMEKAAAVMVLDRVMSAKSHRRIDLEPR